MTNTNPSPQRQTQHPTEQTSTEQTSTGALGGARPTRQRRAVIQVLGDVEGFHTAQEIHGLLGNAGEQVGLATVYRTLQKLTDSGEVDVVRTEDGTAVYRRCSDTHHHHLVCRVCGYTVEVEGPTVERWTSSIAGEHGFADVSHSLELFGICPTCS